MMNTTNCFSSLWVGCWVWHYVYFFAWVLL